LVHNHCFGYRTSSAVTGGLDNLRSQAGLVSTIVVDRKAEIDRIAHRG
jgi:hypothetical protein